MSPCSMCSFRCWMRVPWGERPLSSCFLRGARRAGLSQTLPGTGTGLRPQEADPGALPGKWCSRHRLPDPRGLRTENLTGSCRPSALGTRGPATSGGGVGIRLRVTVKDEGEVRARRPTTVSRTGCPEPCPLTEDRQGQVTEEDCHRDTQQLLRLQFPVGLCLELRDTLAKDSGVFLLPQLRQLGGNWGAGCGGSCQAGRRGGQGWRTVPITVVTAPKHWAQQLSPLSSIPGLQVTPPESGAAPEPGAGCRGTYPGGVHHALGRPSRARREHDEERVAEGQLLKLQLGRLVPFPGREKVVQEHAVGETHGITQSEPPAQAQPRSWSPARPGPGLPETDPSPSGSRGGGGLVSQPRGTWREADGTLTVLQTGAALSFEVRE